MLYSSQLYQAEKDVKVPVDLEHSLLSFMPTALQRTWVGWAPAWGPRCDRHQLIAGFWSSFGSKMTVERNFRKMDVTWVLWCTFYSTVIDYKISSVVLLYWSAFIYKYYLDETSCSLSSHVVVTFVSNCSPCAVYFSSWNKKQVSLYLRDVLKRK